MTNSNISLQWTKHLKTESERKDFEKTLRNSSYTMRRIRDILAEMLVEEQKAKISLKDYQGGDWAYKQAHRNGRVENLNRCLELFNFLGP
jgi:hypothetical protein